MRRFFIFALLLITLVAVFHLSRMIKGWHYVVPAEAGELVYASSFDGEMADWDQDTRSSFAHTVQDGVLRITASADNELPFSAVSPYFRDFDISVTATVVSGDFSSGNENAYGIVFRQDGSRNYYSLFVSGDGYYRILRVVDGIDIERSTWIELDVINTGVGASNQLRVAGSGIQFRFYINNQPLLLCVPLQPDGQSTVNSLTGDCLDGEWTQTLVDDAHEFGQIALAIYGDQAQTTDLTVEFDDVVIYAAQPFEPEAEITPEAAASS